MSFRIRTASGAEYDVWEGDGREDDPDAMPRDEFIVIWGSVLRSGRDDVRELLVRNLGATGLGWHNVWLNMAMVESVR